MRIYGALALVIHFGQLRCWHLAVIAQTRNAASLALIRRRYRAQIRGSQTAAFHGLLDLGSQFRGLYTRCNFVVQLVPVAVKGLLDIKRARAVLVLLILKQPEIFCCFAHCITPQTQNR